MHGIRGGAFATWRELSAAESPHTKSAETATAAAAAGMTSSLTAQLPGSDSRAQDSGGSSSSSSSSSSRLEDTAVSEEALTSAAQQTTSKSQVQVLSHSHRVENGKLVRTACTEALSAAGCRVQAKV